MNAAQLRHFETPAVDRREIERYAGIRGNTSEFDGILDGCLAEILPLLRYDAMVREVPLYFEDGGVLALGFARLVSESLSRHLAGCERAVVFAATVGLAPDRLILKYGRFSPTKALFFQAIGAERIEALCDELCRELDEKTQRNGEICRSRFSPGYGDCPMTVQQDILLALDARKHLGLTLNDSLLMSPSKSVTAIVGIASSDGQTKGSFSEETKQ